ncbi:MAG: alpha amylase C-terminal domain-containing protein [Rhizobacter sp.]|nr:alpha amylase C-terminal domain-containing protein [Chlorobiales bacterium]
MAQIEFKLFAPNNNAVSLKGDFSDWKDIPMTRGDDGNFRTSVDLADGRHLYKFHLQSKSWFFKPDQWVDVVDPYATAIDKNSQCGAINVKNGQRIIDEYVWRHDDKPLPSDHELVIYELHVADFSGGEPDAYKRGKYENVVEKLDYLTGLGINAIELMPIKEYPGDYGWGYNPRHFFATVSSYGETYDLKHLVDECHARGIRVIMDGIYSHAESESPLTQIDHDYWFHHDPQDKENNWGPEFNYEFFDERFHTKPAWTFIRDSICFWIQEYHIDGIRYDAARQINSFEFMHFIVQETKKEAGMKPFYNVAEFLPQNPAVTGPDGPMDGAWHDNFYYRITEHLTGKTFDIEGLKTVIDAKREGFPGATNVVNYLTNHDHNHLMPDLADAGLFDDAAFRRAKLGSAILMTAVGIPLIWMGEEFGEYKYKSESESKIEWALLGNDQNRSLFEHYKGLIALRKNNHALYTENITFFHEDAEAKVLAYVRWNDEGSKVVVILNFSGQFLGNHTIPNFPDNGKWREWTRSFDVESGDGKLTIDLPEYEAKVLVWQS